MNEETLLETEPQPHPFIGDKRKNLSEIVDLENLPSCCKDKRAKHKLSKPGVVKLGLPIPLTSQPPSI